MPAAAEVAVAMVAAAVAVLIETWHVAAAAEALVVLEFEA